MDPSALIFVALAVAWAAYLIPKALEHHEESIRSRTVERFSQGMRVIARREPVSRSESQLTDPRRPAPRPAAPAAPAARTLTPPARRAAARNAARRRRRVLGVILLLNLAMVVAASAGVVAWPFVSITVALLVAWLVACRLMVRNERSLPVGRPVRTVRREVLEEAVVAEQAVPVEEPVEEPAPLEIAETDLTEEHPVVPAEPAPAADGTWEPQPVTLPTYVTKAPAPRRSVRTIDLESTGVWTSGRSEIDSQLVRDTDAAAKALADAKAARAAKRHLG